MQRPETVRTGLSAGSIVLAYVVSAVLWIALSDRVLGALVSDPAMLVTLSTLKGWGFVAVTGTTLGIVLRRYDRQRARQATELEARESRFRLLTEHAQDVVSRYRVLPSPGFEYVSPSVETVLGYPPAAFFDDPGFLASLVHPEDQRLFSPASGAPRVATTVVMRVRHADGHWVWLEQRSTPVLDARGALVAVEGTARDVTERQRADDHLARINRLHRTLSEANQGLVRAQTEPALLATICRSIVEHGGFRFAWVGYRADDPGGTILPMAHAGHEAGYLAAVTIGWHDNVHGRGPAGRAIRSGRPVVSRDLAADPSMAPWSAAARERGYASVAALPLGQDGEVFGVLVIYAEERDAFGPEEIDLLEDLAADLAYGVGALRARAIREAGEAERMRLATAIGQTAESVVITDADANIVYVNPAFERVSGYSSAEVIGQNPRILQSGKQAPAFYADMWSTLGARATWSGELVNRRKDGTTYVEEASITPVVDAAGTVTSYVAVKRDVTHERALEAREVRRGRERTLIADALEALRPLDSAEQTAGEICRRIVELPEVAMASLLFLEPGGNAVPLALAVDDGRVLERKGLGAERSTQLWARAAQGPWVEAWHARAGHPYLADHLAIGLRGQAYAPIRSGATLLGLLTVGSRDPNAVALLTERLPAILEFASLAGALVAPSAAITSATEATRGVYRAIIDDLAFHPVFQPVVDLMSGAVVGYEALTRFTDGTRPDLVFAGARSCGLEHDLESATLRAAIAASEALPGERFLSLNVSPSFILAGDALRAILATRTRPIVLEITEHDPVEDYAALRSAFVALGSGLRLAVDDAGAGVANFNHLVELRPQFVKVDIGLVRSVNADLTRQALIVALLHFASATDCQVIAEGIETEGERAVLAKLEVPLGQGYLLGRPGEAATWAASDPAPPSRRRAGFRAISGGQRPQP